MKIIINESQLRLIVENENKDGNLLDLTDVYGSGVSPNKWDDIFLLLKEKKERKGDKTYDGYYIDEYVELYGSDVTELKYLVKVGDTLDLFRTQIKSLPKLKRIGDILDIENTPLGEELNKTMSKEEIKNKFGVKHNLYIYETKNN